MSAPDATTKPKPLNRVSSSNATLPSLPSLKMSHVVKYPTSFSYPAMSAGVHEQQFRGKYRRQDEKEGTESVTAVHTGLNKKSNSINSNYDINPNLPLPSTSLPDHKKNDNVHRSPSPAADRPIAVAAMTAHPPLASLLDGTNVARNTAKTKKKKKQARRAVSEKPGADSNSFFTQVMKKDSDVEHGAVQTLAIQGEPNVSSKEAKKVRHTPNLKTVITALSTASKQTAKDGCDNDDAKEEDGYSEDYSDDEDGDDDTDVELDDNRLRIDKQNNNIVEVLDHSTSFSTTLSRYDDISITLDMTAEVVPVSRVGSPIHPSVPSSVPWCPRPRTCSPTARKVTLAGVAAATDVQVDSTSKTEKSDPKEGALVPSVTESRRTSSLEARTTALAPNHDGPDEVANEKSTQTDDAAVALRAPSPPPLVRFPHLCDVYGTAVQKPENSAPSVQPSSISAEDSHIHNQSRDGEKEASVEFSRSFSKRKKKQRGKSLLNVRTPAFLRKQFQIKINSVDQPSKEQYSCESKDFADIRVESRAASGENVNQESVPSSHDGRKSQSPSSVSATCTKNSSTYINDDNKAFQGTLRRLKAQLSAPPPDGGSCHSQLRATLTAAQAGRTKLPHEDLMSGSGDTSSYESLVLDVLRAYDTVVVGLQDEVASLRMGLRATQEEYKEEWEERRRGSQQVATGGDDRHTPGRRGTGGGVSGLPALPGSANGHYPVQPPPNPQRQQPRHSRRNSSSSYHAFSNNSSVTDNEHFHNVNLNFITHDLPAPPGMGKLAVPTPPPSGGGGGHRPIRIRTTPPYQAGAPPQHKPYTADNWTHDYLPSDADTSNDGRHLPVLY